VCVSLQTHPGRAFLHSDGCLTIIAEDTLKQSCSVARGSARKMVGLSHRAARCVDRVQQLGLRVPVQLVSTMGTRRVLQTALLPISADAKVFGKAMNGSYDTDAAFAKVMAKAAHKLNLKTRRIGGVDVVPNTVGYRGRDGFMYVVQIVCTLPTTM